MVSFDNPDPGKSLSNDFGQSGKRGLDLLVATVHFFTEKAGADHNQGHWNQDE